MNRRGFLTGMIAAAVLDPERLLWVPGRKTISIPRIQAARYVHVQYELGFTIPYDHASLLSQFIAQQHERHRIMFAIELERSAALCLESPVLA